MTARCAILVVSAGLAAALAMTGCAPSVRYESDEGARTLAEAEAFAAGFDVGKWERRPASQAGSLRNRALGDLRGRGGDAAVLADLLTEGFTTSRGVPVHIVEGNVDDRATWTVVEVYGPPDGRLDRVRLWVLSRPDGRVVSSSAYP